MIRLFHYPGNASHRDPAATCNAVKHEQRTSVTLQRNLSSQWKKRKEESGKADNSATDGARLSVRSRTAALNWALAEADQPSVYTKEGSQQRDFQGEQTPWGCGEYELTWM